MEIEKYMQGAVTVIILDGELDSTTAPGVHEQLGDLVPAGSQVLIDLSKTSYMSSAGLRVLLLLYRQAKSNGARLGLACAPDDMRMVMSATGFLDFFAVADSVADGLLSLSA